MRIALLLPLLLIAAARPSLPQHFSEDGNPSHVFLVVDSRTGEVLRSEGDVATTALPLGSSAYWILALAGMEDHTLRARTPVPCTDSCWAKGSHGEPQLLEALAFSCDSYNAHLFPKVGDAAFRRLLRDIGFAAEGASVEPSPDDGGFDGAELRVTAEQWTHFWRMLLRDKKILRATSVATLLSASVTTVRAPRGVAHSLFVPRMRVRAVPGESAAGAWVVGTKSVRGSAPWIYALFVHGGTAPLAVSRASHLLRETERMWRKVAPQRRGVPLPPLDLGTR